MCHTKIYLGRNFVVKDAREIYYKWNCKACVSKRNKDALWCWFVKHFGSSLYLLPYDIFFVEFKSTLSFQFIFSWFNDPNTYLKDIIIHYLLLLRNFLLQISREHNNKIRKVILRLIVSVRRVLRYEWTKFHARFLHISSWNNHISLSFDSLVVNKKT